MKSTAIFTALIAMASAVFAQPPLPSWKVLPKPTVVDGGVVFEFANFRTQQIEVRMDYRVRDQLAHAHAILSTNPADGDTMIYLDDVDDTFELVSVSLSAALGDGKTYTWQWKEAKAGVYYTFEYPKIKR